MLRLVTVSPFPERIFNIALGYEKVVFFEEGSIRGGAAEGFLAELARRGFRGRAECAGVADGFVPAAAVDEQLAMYGLDVDGMTELLRA